MKRTAFVTGMTGQDGPYLAKLLVEKGYHVYGLVKRYSNPNLDNLRGLGIENDIELITGDITDENYMNHLMQTLKPAEVYILAAQSFVGASWDIPLHHQPAPWRGLMGPLFLVHSLERGRGTGGCGVHIPHHFGPCVPVEGRVNNWSGGPL
jgi:GDPmannose 4,6-dehydratase